jgi:predicted phosphodiesterase
LHCVRADYPGEWTTARLYALADLHIGDPTVDVVAIYDTLKRIKDDPYALCVLNGDLMNTATRNGVSDVYGEVIPPMEQITAMCKMLEPIKDKIVGVTGGNHEARVYKMDGIDMTRLVCRQLGIEEKYSPDGVLVFLRFGKRGGQSRHSDQVNAQWYSIYATHGSGGGRKEGAKAIRLADMAAIVDADVYIHSHTHLPMIFREAFFRVNVPTGSAALVDKLFVNTGAALGYGGYGQQQEYKPSSTSTPIITFDARNKRATATL